MPDTTRPINSIQKLLNKVATHAPIYRRQNISPNRRRPLQMSDESPLTYYLSAIDPTKVPKIALEAYPVKKSRAIDPLSNPIPSS